VFVTSTDSNLTSAHVRYLEAQLYRRAKELGRIGLANATEPAGGADLPEADKADTDYFIRQILILLPVLGVEFLRGRTAEDEARCMAVQGPRSENSQTDADSPMFKLDVPKTGVAARAQVIDGEFTVLAESIIARKMTAQKDSQVLSSSTYARMSEQSEHYRKEGSIIDNISDERTARLVRNVQFTSPSAAAAFVQGHVTANGRIAWKTDDKRTYEAWESHAENI